MQQRYKIGTKAMFNVVAFFIVLIDGWGMIGIWTDKFGFHHLWEIWVGLASASRVSWWCRGLTDSSQRPTKPFTASSSARGIATRRS